MSTRLLAKAGHRRPTHRERAQRAPFVVILLLMLAAGACGSGRTYPGQDPFRGDSGPPQLRIRVQNLNFYDARLTTIGDNGRRRLGTVGGNQRAVFRIPWAFPTGMRIEIDLLAGPSCITEAIVVEPGDEIQFQIPANLETYALCR